MAAKPSMGEVLTLSHTAKSIGKIFGIKAAGVPQDFFEVDRETQGLADALKLLAYTIEEDDLILQSPREVQKAIFAILSTAQSTLKDLATFLERYCTVRKVPSKDGMAGDKIWSRTVLADWRTLPWTREGGDILALRSLLMMHCTTITLTTQALQSRSFERLQTTVLALADKLLKLHADQTGQLNARLDELHTITTRIMNEQRAAAVVKDEVQFDFDLSSQSPMNQEPMPSLSHLEIMSVQQTPPPPADVSTRKDQSAKRSSRQSVAMRNDYRQPEPQPRQQPQPQPETDRSFSRTSTRSENTRPTSRLSLRRWSSKRSKSVDQDRKSIKLPSGLVGEDCKSYFTSSDEEGGGTGGRRNAPGAPRKLVKKNRSKRKSTAPAPIVERQRSASNLSQIKKEPTFERDSTAPDYVVDDRLTRRDDYKGHTSPHARADSKTPTEGLMQGYSFMDNLLRDSIKIFDGPADLVEATSSDEHARNTNQSSNNTIVSKACRVLIVRKVTDNGHGMPSSSSSIWILANDGSVCASQLLPTTTEPRTIAPHLSYTALDKVVLTLPTEIHYHSGSWEDENEEPLAVLPADRVAFNFTGVHVAAKFQSAVFGQRLIASFEIEKAFMIRPSGTGSFLRSLFASEELMCHQQRLRLWEDDGTTHPSNIAGGVCALLSLQHTFGDGWIKWWVNSARITQFKSKGASVVEIRGIDAVVSRPSPSNAYSFDRFRQSSMVTGRSILADGTSQNAARSSLDTRPASFDRPHTSMSGRTDMASTYTRSLRRSGSISTMRSSQTANSNLTAQSTNSTRSFRGLRNFSFGLGSRSRSRSSSVASHSQPNGAVPADTSEPLPPPLLVNRRDSGNSSVDPSTTNATSSIGTASTSATTAYKGSSPTPSNLYRSSFHTTSGSTAGGSLSFSTLTPPTSNPGTRSHSAMSMPINPLLTSTSGKWDNPVAPRHARPLGSHANRFQSPMTDAEIALTAPPPPPPVVGIPGQAVELGPEQGVTASPTAIRQLRSEYSPAHHAQGRADSRASSRPGSRQDNVAAALPARPGSSRIYGHGGVAASASSPALNTPSLAVAVSVAHHGNAHVVGPGQQHHRGAPSSSSPSPVPGQHHYHHHHHQPQSRLARTSGTHSRADSRQQQFPTLPGQQAQQQRRHRSSSRDAADAASIASVRSDRSGRASSTAVPGMASPGREGRGGEGDDDDNLDGDGERPIGHHPAPGSGSGSPRAREKEERRQRRRREKKARASAAGARSARRSTRVVHGVRLHFSSPAEKNRFLDAVKRAREHMLALGDC